MVALCVAEKPDSSKYDEVIRRLTKIGLRVPDGQMYNICYGDRRQLQVINVFETPAKLDSFGAKLMPILTERSRGVQWNVLWSAACPFTKAGQSKRLCM